MNCSATASPATDSVPGAVGDGDAEHFQIGIARSAGVRRRHMAAHPALDGAQGVGFEEGREYARRDAIVALHESDAQAFGGGLVDQRVFPLRARPTGRQRSAREKHQRHVGTLRLAGFLGQVFAGQHLSRVEQDPHAGAALDKGGDALGESAIGRRETQE